MRPSSGNRVSDRILQMLSLQLVTKMLATEPIPVLCLVCFTWTRTGGV